MSPQRLRANESQIASHPCRCDGATHAGRANIAHAPLPVDSPQDRECRVAVVLIAGD